MLIPTFWQERDVPLLYVKGDNVVGCKLKLFGYDQSEITNWFGNIYGFKYFGKHKEKPWSFNDELLMVVFEILNTFIFARFYIWILLGVVFGGLWSLITLDLYPFSIWAVIAISLYLWPKLSGLAYKHFVEDIPQKKGWSVIPFFKKEHFEAATKYVPEDELMKWLKR